MELEKEIRRVGSSYGDLIAFPDEARRQAGFQLVKIHAGLDPDNWKPFDTVGPARAKFASLKQEGAFRVMYVAKFVEAVYVLHGFQKKTQATSRHDRQIAEMRYRAIAM
ncbi:type II toxin-antitoxin system RelE/ParE family toxin [Paraburkholderia bengalensis]|uniref:Type II toxin-antitoxin system RelE/ParE family toxin n=1 Tax=Paraburkholderia bengalensis TaxID=2747562 RepID=A0ABU8IUW3_9BURK